MKMKRKFSVILAALLSMSLILSGIIFADNTDLTEISETEDAASGIALSVNEAASGDEVISENEAVSEDAAAAEIEIGNSTKMTTLATNDITAFADESRNVYVANLDETDIWKAAGKKSGNPIAVFTDKGRISNSTAVSAYYKEEIPGNAFTGDIKKGYFILSDAQKDYADEQLLDTSFVAQNADGDMLMSIYFGDDKNTEHSLVLDYQFTAPKAGRVFLTTKENIKSSIGSGGKITYNVNKYKVGANGNNSGSIALTGNTEMNSIGEKAYTTVVTEVEAGQEIHFATYNTGTNMPTVSGEHYVKWTPVVVYADDKPVVSDVSYDRESGELTFTTNKANMAKENLKLYIENEEATPFVIERLDTVNQSAGIYKAVLSKTDREEQFVPGTKFCVKVFEEIKSDEISAVLQNESDPVIFEVEGERYRYRASDSFDAANKNSDPIWRWQYKDALTGYADLPTNTYVNLGMRIPDGETSYVAGQAYTKTSENQRLAVGKFIMIPQNAAHASSSGNANESAVRTFTAPNSGIVTISAADPNRESKVWGGMSASNKNSPDMKIFKNDVQVWPEGGGSFSFEYVAQKDNANKEQEFEPFNLDISEGDKLHFEISAKGNWWGNSLYWNPVVTYNAIEPKLVNQNFANGEEYVPNYKFTMEFDKEMAAIAKEDIAIDNGAEVNSVSLDRTNKKLTMDFSKVQSGGLYNVTIGGLRYATVTDAKYSFTRKFSFVGGGAVSANNITLVGGTLQNGDNTVTADINNSDDSAAVTATLIVAVMKGTKDDYEIESVSAVTDTQITGVKTLSATVNIPDAQGRFIRVVAVDDRDSLNAYADAVDFS